VWASERLIVFEQTDIKQAYFLYLKLVAEPTIRYSKPWRRLKKPKRKGEYK